MLSFFNSVSPKRMTGCDSERREAPQANREIADDSSPYALNHAGELKCASHNAFATLHYYLQPVINMTKVMFICHGNICRSPMAEFILKDMVKRRGIADDFVIASSATSTEEIWGDVGNPVYPPAQRELASHGISYGDKRAVQLTKSDYARYDYLLCMDKMNLRNAQRILGADKENKLRLLLSFADGGSIADPWYCGNFDRTYSDIVRGCEGFLEFLGY